MNVTPCAVAGRCRWVTAPATSTRLPSGTDSRRLAGTTPIASRFSRRNWTGWLSGETPVAQTSAAANSSSVMPGSDGTCDEDPTPGSRSGRSEAAAPAAHSASRRSIPKQPERARGGQRLGLRHRQLHPAGQIDQRRERAVGLSVLDDALGQLVADVPDRAEAEPHLEAGVLQRRVRQAGVHVGTVHDHPVPTGVGDQRLRRVEAHRLGPQQRRAEHRRDGAA